MPGPWHRTDAALDLVVIGLGYVGLALARAASAAGLRVGGLDISANVVDGLLAGRSHIDDVCDEDVMKMLNDGFSPTQDESVLDGADTAVICVPTPLAENGRPDLAAVRAASETVARHIRPGLLVVLESTTYPGTTEELVRPILEGPGLIAGEHFHLAFSPERIDPGNLVYGIRNTPKVVGGLTAGCAAAAARFYSVFVDTVVLAKGTREAEMSKLLENTYRYINIALVNEMAIVCRELGIDIWDAIECAATKPFGFATFRPGPGVGGHCIPIDPGYLSFKAESVGHSFRFVEVAKEISDQMPRYVVDRAARLLAKADRTLNGTAVLILGVTYKADTSDQREAPAQAVARHLLARGAALRFHDPHVTTWMIDGVNVPSVGTDLTAALAAADLTLLLVGHREYEADILASHARMLLDACGRVRELTLTRPPACFEVL